MIDPDEIRERAIGSMYEKEFRELADEIERLQSELRLLTKRGRQYQLTVPPAQTF